MSNEIKEIASIVNENQKPQLVQVFDQYIQKGEDGQSVKAVQALLVPENMKVESVKDILDEYLDRPKRRTDGAVLDRKESFIDYTNRFKSENSALFARGKVNGSHISASIYTVFDFHPSTSQVQDADNCDHRASYNFPISKEFKRWIENNTRLMDQSSFAYFIEDNLIDLAAADQSDMEKYTDLKPLFADPIRMLEMSRGLSLKNNENVKQKFVTSTGETEIQFTSEHTDEYGSKVSIPNFFMINIPIFEMGLRYRVAVRLRYRVKDGSVKFAYDIYRIEDLFDSVFNETCNLIAEKTGLPLFMGVHN